MCAQVDHQHAEGEDVNHVGASIRDLSKRWFAIIKMQETKAEEILRRL